MDVQVRGILKDFIETNELEHMDESDAFELLVAWLFIPQNTTKQCTLSELALDGGAPGIDTLIISINGQLMWSASDVDDIAKKSESLEVKVTAIQAKTSPSVDSAQILNMGNILRQFADENSTNIANYPRLQDLKEAFLQVFNHPNLLREAPKLQAYFITTAKTKSVEDGAVQQVRNQVNRDITENTPFEDVDLSVFGADEIITRRRERARSNSATIEMPKRVALPKTSGIEQAVLGVLSIDEILDIITEDNEINESVFYENVRGFQGEANNVNAEILKTLKSQSDAQLLPFLNNGITVIAKKLTMGAGDDISIEGYQIVNGCQTANCIYEARKELGSSAENIFVPMRVIIPSQTEALEKIIRATNSQTPVKHGSMLALNPYQKRLEDYFNSDDHLNVDLSYERREGQYINENRTSTRIISVLELLRASTSILLEQPHLATRYPGQLVSDVDSLDVFKEDHNPACYLAFAFTFYKIEAAFRAGWIEAKYKALRYHLMLTITRVILDHSFNSPTGKKGLRDAELLVEGLKSDRFRAKLDESVEILDSIHANSGNSEEKNSIPSRDRLKRQAFTNDILAYFSRK